MDIITYSANLEKQMRERLDELNKSATLTSSTPPDPISLAARRLSFISEIMDELREFLYGYKFVSGDEEIKFFKEIKPVFGSQYLFHKEVYSISLVDSFMTAKEKRKYYNSILAHLLQYAKRHRDFYLYCMTGDKSKDELYFKRAKRSSDPMKDRLFTTDRSEDLAVILSHVLIKDYLHGLIAHLKGSHTTKSSLKWTGKKTDLIELLFALHATGSLNNADAEVKQLAEVFESAFNIDLGNYYDYLRKIRGRKTGQISFIDSLKSSLKMRLDTFDGQ